MGLFSTPERFRKARAPLAMQSPPECRHCATHGVCMLKTHHAQLTPGCSATLNALLLEMGDSIKFQGG